MCVEQSNDHSFKPPRQLFCAVAVNTIVCVPVVPTLSEVGISSLSHTFCVPATAVAAPWLYRYCAAPEYGGSGIDTSMCSP